MEYNPFSITGKTILITGASSGIGRATAIECSKAGAKVVITGRNIDRLNDTLSHLEGDGHTAIPADLTDETQVEKLVSECPALDGASFCAGILDTTLFNFASKDKFLKVYDNNFFSPMELLRLLIKKKKLGKNSSVVFVVSVAANKDMVVGNSLYGSAKAAMSAMIGYLALEYASKNIRINGVYPSLVATEAIRGGSVDDTYLAKELEKYPLKRFGKPEEIAWAMMYFLSDAAQWVTGSTLVLDGGSTLK